MELNYSLLASKIDGWTGRDIKEKLMKNLVHDAIINGNTELITTEMALNLIAQLQKASKAGQTNPLVS